jgi:hypothetical protein
MYDHPPAVVEGHHEKWKYIQLWSDMSGGFQPRRSDMSMPGVFMVLRPWATFMDHTERLAFVLCREKKRQMEQQRPIAEKSVLA